MEALEQFIGRVISLILQPLVGLIFAAALFYFVWGASAFILKADEAKERDTARRHMVWGVIGFFIMVSVYSILRVVTETFCDSAFCR